MFNAPLSVQRANTLIRNLDLKPEQTVLDLGCGDGKFLRMIGEHHTIHGTGYDNNPALIEQANNLWNNHSTTSHLKFICADASTLEDTLSTDVIVCIGSEFIFGGFRQFLQKAQPMLTPHGRILVGTIYWKHTPENDYLALMGGENPHFDLETTVEIAHQEGFIPLEIQRSNDDEWDEFESAHASKRYLTAIDTHDLALKQRTQQWQQGYLKWGMSTMGFCFLTLQKST